MTEQLVGQFGYVGIALILILGGLGLPIPEEAPIILAAVLARHGQLSSWSLAFASCLSGVLLGDLLVYFLGFVYGEKVLSLPVTRKLLTRQREAQMKGYFHRHGFKILVSGRFVPGFRTAAYLTAGILQLPAIKLFLTDLVAATLSTALMFGLGYAFAHQIQSGIREVQQWIVVIVALGVASWLLYRYYDARRRGGRPIGPPVLDSDDVPIPSADHPSSAMSWRLNDGPVMASTSGADQKSDTETVAVPPKTLVGEPVVELADAGPRAPASLRPVARPGMVEAASSSPSVESPSR